MRRVALGVALTAIGLSGTGALAGGAPPQDTTDYAIADYSFTVRMLPPSSSARVTMDLTYLIRSGVKSEGFKYIGTITPADVAGTEDDGRPMTMSVERKRETLIRWRFTPAREGRKHVRVEFTIPGALTGDQWTAFTASWAGVFRVPVQQARYRMVLPETWTGNSITTQPLAHTRSTMDGHRTVDVVQAPLSDPVFAVTLRPAVAGVVIAPVPLASRADEASGASADPVKFILAGVVLLALFVISRSKASTRTGTSSGSSCSSTSSCAGGSSCSSGCGGGGCGGGCGG
jgi:hypothetical protein